jgi:hypothetical protein
MVSWIEEEEINRMQGGKTTERNKMESTVEIDDVKSSHSDSAITEGGRGIK